VRLERPKASVRSGSETSERREGDRIARFFSPFTEIRAAEATTALIVTAQAFVLLTVYYLLKPVRESWILPGGAELKTYLAAVQAIALLGIAKGYDMLARRMRRDRMVSAGAVIAALSLALFASAAAAGLDVAIAFYLWLGAFQLLLIAQLWSFATDLYTVEQGRRIFPMIGAGGALGSLVGAQLARLAMRASERPMALLLTAAALLLVIPVLASIAHRRAARARRRQDVGPPEVAIPDAIDRGMLSRVLADPYLRLVAAFTVLLNAITTLGEYALDRTLLESAGHAVALGEAESVEQYIGAFKADYYGAITVLVLVLQLFAVSRVLRVFGERAALALLPIVLVIGACVTLGASALALVPMLGMLATQRVIENGIAHSIESTARQSLYLVTTREGRWSGKAVIDTVTWRSGDVLGALLVALLATSGAGVEHAIACGLGLGVAWLAIVRALGREHRARELAVATVR
jgi:AAA family ATP:ADP antiporter